VATLTLKVDGIGVPETIAVAVGVEVLAEAAKSAVCVRACMVCAIIVGTWFTSGSC
jgi:hypothetical protein